MAFVPLLDQLPALRVKLGSVCIGWKACVGIFSLASFFLLVALLPMTAAGDTQAAQAAQAVVGKQESKVAAVDKTEIGKAHQVCLGCHNMSEESINQQPRQAQKKHRKVMEEQGLCTECHNKATIMCCHDNLF